MIYCCHGQTAIHRGDNHMSKEYVFDFSGTKEDFLNILKGSKHDYASGDYYLGDYRVKFKDDEIHFGVERGGHSGGYWFIPTITEFDDRIEFRGTIRCIDPSNNRGAIRKTIDSIGVFLFFILISPIVLILKLYTLAEWIVRKMRNCPKPKEKTFRHNSRRSPMYTAN